MFKYINVKNVVNKQEKDLTKFILDNDSRYRGQLFTLADKIISKNKVQIVLLSGPSCAGKTTTANLLKQVLELKGVTVDGNIVKASGVIEKPKIDEIESSFASMGPYVLPNMILDLLLLLRNYS